MKDILYWGDKRVGERLKEKSERVFIAKNFSEFESLMNEYMFPVFYVESTRTCLKKLQTLVKKNHDKNFYILSRMDDKYPNYNVFIICEEPNVSKRPLSVQELLTNIEAT